MVRNFLKPRNAAEAQAIVSSGRGILPLAGGTFLLSSGVPRKEVFDAVSLAGILPSGIVRSGEVLELGANATFQDILDSPAAPAVLKDAARGMADRNIRNRATSGGNAGADKSCASLVPVFLATDAAYVLADGSTIGAAAWQALPRERRGIIASIRMAFPATRRFAYARWSRTSCDVSVLTACVSYEGRSAPAVASATAAPLSGLRVALGGVAPHARRFPAIEALFEGRPLPAREEIEALVAPLLSPVGDQRGSAAFKRARMAMLVADALWAADALYDASVAMEARS